MAGMDEARLHKAESEAARPRGSVVAAIDALELQPWMRVLDAGCGPGAHLGLFAAKVVPGGHVVGLDIGADELEIAAHICRATITDGTVELRQGDAQQLPFEAGTFDLAWAALAL